MPFIDSVEISINRRQYTNLYLYEILIADYLDNHTNYNGLTMIEISERWGNNERYIKSFYPSYVQRKIGPNGILSIDVDRYKIRETEVGFQNLLTGQLLNNVREAIDAPNPVIDKIDFFSNTVDSENFFREIIELLREGTPNDFEVLTYAILREYIKIFGFELHRFTPTNANDGGVDFIGGNVIYCITTELNQNKLRADIGKTRAPKIFIYRNLIGQNIQEEIDEYIYDGKLFDTLNAETIIHRYLTYLKEKPASFRMVEKLKTTIVDHYEMEIV